MKKRLLKAMNFSFSRIVARIVASCHFNDKATGFVMSNSIIKTARRTFVLGLAFCFTAALAGCSEKPEPVSFSAQTDDGVFNSTQHKGCLLYTSPSPRDKRQSRMPSSA